MFDQAMPGGNAEAPRDRWGRPMLLPPGTTERQAFTRVTTLAGALDDKQNLMAWHGRQVAIGLSRRSDLLALVATHGDDKRALNSICDDAKAAAASDAAANIGTALHAFTERIDLGLPLGDVPADMKPALAQYVGLRKRLGIGVEDVELFVANLDLRVAGTTDRIITLAGGRRYIADIKTGSVEYAQRSIAVQLACYAHSRRYDIASDTWGETLDVDNTTAFVIHLPPTGEEARLLPVDIGAGWEAAMMSARVRRWRRTQVLGQPWQAGQ